MLFCIWKSSTKEDFKSSLGELKAGAGGVTVQRRKEWVVERREAAETEPGTATVLKAQIRNVDKLQLDRSQLL